MLSVTEFKHVTLQLNKQILNEGVLDQSRSGPGPVHFRSLNQGNISSLVTEAGTQRCCCKQAAVKMNEIKHVWPGSSME